MSYPFGVIRRLRELLVEMEKMEKVEESQPSPSHQFAVGDLVRCIDTSSFFTHTKLPSSLVGVIRALEVGTGLILVEWADFCEGHDGRLDSFTSPIRRPGSGWWVPLRVLRSA